MSGKTILALTQDPNADASLRDISCQHGMLIYFAKNKLEFEVGLQSAVDIVYLDIAMPDFDGIEAVNVLAEKRPSLPSIIINGFDNKLCQMVAHYAEMKGIAVVAMLAPTDPPESLREILAE